MGIHDRDWYRIHGKKSAYSLPESVKDERTSRLRKRLDRYSSHHVGTSPRHGVFLNALLWLSLLSLISAFFFWREAPAISYTNGVAEVIVPKSSDGHFYVDGHINGAKIRFLIDTGASFTAVSAAMASQLGLLPDSSATFNTANGQVRAKIASRQSVTVAGLGGRPLTISILPSLSGEALLGQNFLSQVSMTQTGQLLVLRGSAHSGKAGNFDSRTKWSLIIGIGLLLLAVGLRRHR